MSNSHELRSCPTRIDGAPALFAHKVTPSLCQGRQQNRYHKCFSCAYGDAYVAENGLPPAETPEPIVELVPAGPNRRPAPAPTGPAEEQPVAAAAGRVARVG